jgi:hypothetical protein
MPASREGACVEDDSVGMLEVRAERGKAAMVFLVRVAFRYVFSSNTRAKM